MKKHARGAEADETWCGAGRDDAGTERASSAGRMRTHMTSCGTARPGTGCCSALGEVVPLGLELPERSTGGVCAETRAGDEEYGELESDDAHDDCARRA